MKVAICDDNEKVCEDLYAILESYRISKQINIEVDIFLSGKELISNISSGEYYDLIFLDIELNDVELGSAVGVHIRNIIKNHTSKIVYISAYTKYAMNLFESRPLDFIEKPVTKEKIEKIIDVYNTISNEDSDFIKINIDGSTHIIMCKDIMYFIKKLRKVYIVTIDSQYESYYNLDEASKYKGFLRIHKSYVINVNFIKIHTYRQITLTNGKEFSISQAYRNDVKEFIKKL